MHNNAAIMHGRWALFLNVLIRSVILKFALTVTSTSWRDHEQVTSVVSTEPEFEPEPPVFGRRSDELIAAFLFKCIIYYRSFMLVSDLPSYWDNPHHAHWSTEVSRGTKITEHDTLNGQSRWNKVINISGLLSFDSDYHSCDNSSS